MLTKSLTKSGDTTGNTGRKLALSASLIFVSTVYAVYQNLFLLNPSTNIPVVTPTPIVVTNTPPPVTTPTPTPVPTPTPTPVPKPKGKYKDGTYTGSVADAYYGNIQVQAVIQNSALSDVIFLQHPNDRSTSVRINNNAMPILKQEAISAQGANVNIVSGATDSSQAFQQSLGVALAMAKN